MISIQLLKNRSVPLLQFVKRLKSNEIYYDEKDIEEQFIRGWGPGGQSVNKTSNAVHLRHTKTGIIIKNHDTRSLEQNRKLAREILNDKLDVMLNGDNAKSSQEKKEQNKKERDKYSKSIKRLELKKNFKESLKESEVKKKD